ATIMNTMIDWTKFPQPILASLYSMVCPDTSNPPVISPMIGMKTSFTSEFTIAVNAAPITIPIARSMTLPRMMNFLNSSKNFRIGVLQGIDSRGFAVASLFLRGRVDGLQREVRVRRVLLLHQLLQLREHVRVLRGHVGRFRFVRREVV